MGEIKPNIAAPREHNGKRDCDSAATLCLKKTQNGNTTIKHLTKLPARFSSRILVATFNNFAWISPKIAEERTRAEAVVK